MATIGLVVGTFVGYLTQYVNTLGIPAVQSLIASGMVYLVAMQLKAVVKPDHFTEDIGKEEAVASEQAETV